MYTYKKANPALRFPEFLDDWRLVELGSLFRERVEFTEEDLPLWSLTIEGGVVPKTERYERRFLVQSEDEAYKVMYRDDFAFNPMNLRLGALARLNNSDRVLVSQYYNVFLCNELVDPVFAENYLTTHNLIQFYNKMATGSLEEKKRVHYSEFTKFHLPFPELPEQRKIAAFLSLVDEKIRQLARKKEILLKYKKGVMQQIFDQKIRFKDDNHNDFPDWEEKRFGDVFTFIPTNSFSREDLNYLDGEVKNVHYGDIHTKFRPLLNLDREQLPFINREISLAKTPKANYLRTGDLVFADASEDYADVGKCIEIGRTNGQRVLAGLHTLLARPKANTLARGFGTYLMKSWSTRWQIMREAQGTKVFGISTGRLAKIKLKFPSSAEQAKLGGFISAIEMKMELVNRQLQETKRFKKGLLQQMFV